MELSYRRSMARTPSPPGAATRPAANDRSPNRKPRTRSLVPPAERPARKSTLWKQARTLVSQSQMDGFERRVVEKVAALVKVEVAGKIEQMLLAKAEEITEALVALSTGSDPHPESVRYALDRILGKPTETSINKNLNVNVEITEIEVRLPTG